jgi:ADP-dependent phosphofructokinase/glucokinase
VDEVGDEVNAKNRTDHQAIDGHMDGRGYFVLCSWIFNFESSMKFSRYATRLRISSSNRLTIAWFFPALAEPLVTTIQGQILMLRRIF